MKKLNCIGVIPSRYGSTRFPAKPLSDICGKPMVWYVYQQAKKVKTLSAVYVATDDQRIADVCEKYDMNYIMTSTEHKTPNDRVHEVSTKIDADIYVCINGDEPLIEPEVIERALPDENDIDDLEYYYSNIITTITNPVEVVDPTNIKAVVNAKGEAMWASRSPIPFPKGNMQFEYKKIVGIAAFSKKALQFYVDTPRSQVEYTEELDLYRFLENGKKVKLKEIECHTLSVDTPKDLEKVREVIQNKINKEG
ncbi:3-deoxy-manno-octulosonate cytidylyltransferase [uncultured Ruminococcus sp.]|uniref:3-deoxy-manno-octulosonate cytidylyltransferase n=1 Tax=uncultured Ruminococcus sp. TaxID=165186 RepID=UPI0025F142BC|nr:3-deoxy-manno-octulosonate cytidylyltransferase [uncultured Ruminococcus sp.]